MPNPSKRSKTTEYERALEIVLAEGFWVLQRQDRVNGRWMSVGGRLKGRETALVTLNKMKMLGGPSYRYRVVQEVEAQAYSEGWRAAERFAEGKHSGESNVDAEKRKARAVGADRR